MATRSYRVAHEGPVMIVTCDPIGADVWEISCGPLCEDGMVTVTVAKKTLRGSIQQTIVMSYDNTEALADRLRELLPAELLA